MVILFVDDFFGLTIKHNIIFSHLKIIYNSVFIKLYKVLGLSA